MNIIAQQKGSVTMKMRKILLIASLLLALTVTLSGTLAYLNDTDSDVNVMTLGNVQIEQLENGLNERGFQQGQPLYPAYYTGEPSLSAAGAIEKRVNVKNVGESDAYIRTVFAFEAGELSRDEFDKYIHLLWNVDEASLKWGAEKITVRGEQYFLAWYVYPAAVAANTETDPTLLGVVMDKAADNTVMTKLGDKDYNILVVSQAVQTTNMDELFALDGAASVLDEAFGKLSASSHPWMDQNGVTDENGDQNPDDIAFVKTAEELIKAIKDGAKYIQLTGDILIDENTEFMFEDSNGSPLYLYHNELTLDLNGHNINVTENALMDGKNQATGAMIVRYAALNIVGEGSFNVENQGINVYGWANSEINIYGGTYTGNAFERNESVVYVNNDSVTIHVYGGDFTGADYAFNVKDTCIGARIVLHEGIEFKQFLKNGTDLILSDLNSGRIVLAEGCELQTAVVDGVKWYKVVKTANSDTVIAKTAAEAQAALDNAVPGTKVQLVSDVDYGTLLVRPVLNAAHTESGNWQTGNYATELARTIENVTIIGAKNAKVDAIHFDAGYKGSSYIAGAPDLMNYITIRNLVIDGVEFSGKSEKPIYISLQNTNLDGLTVKNCKLSGNANANLVYIYGSQGNHTFATASKDVTITGNTVDNVLRLCELRGTENVTISNNIIKNTAEHAMLLALDQINYSGTVTVSGNTAYSIKDRFLRMAGAGDATVIIKDNTVTAYKGADEDFIKVTTDSTTLHNYTGSNNQCFK